MHINNFINFHPFVLKVLTRNTVLHKARAITLLKINENNVLRHNMDLVYINAYTKFYQNFSNFSDDIEEKHIFASMKGNNSVVYKWI